MADIDANISTIMHTVTYKVKPTEVLILKLFVKSRLIGKQWQSSLQIHFINPKRTMCMRSITPGQCVLAMAVA